MHKKVYIVEEGYGKEKKDSALSMSQQPIPPAPWSFKKKKIPILMS